MKIALARLLSLLALGVWVQGVWAQIDEIGDAFKKMPTAEEQRLRAILAAPVPQGVASENGK